ncbi:MAG: tyrosine-protein phosphatase [Faecalibacterium sp.]
MRSRQTHPAEIITTGWRASARKQPPFVLDTIRSQFGSAENYLEAEYGLTPARLMRLRRMYLE